MAWVIEYSMMLLTGAGILWSAQSADVVADPIRAGINARESDGNIRAGTPHKLFLPPVGTLERLLRMSPEQRERVLEKLPAAKRDELRSRFERFNRRPFAERSRLIALWRYVESLPSGRRELLLHQIEVFNALDEARRVPLLRALNELRRMDPQSRQERLASSALTSRFSSSELKMLADISEIYPFLAR
jgi:hypothetical protein